MSRSPTTAHRPARLEIAGGIDIFADRRHQGAAKNRIVTAEEVVAREPDLIIGFWCGKKFRPERVITT
jgi:iron complex transport system substrate-binding protein